MTNIQCFISTHNTCSRFHQLHMQCRVQEACDSPYHTSQELSGLIRLQTVTSCKLCGLPSNCGCHRAINTTVYMWSVMANDNKTLIKLQQQNTWRQATLTDIVIDFNARYTLRTYTDCQIKHTQTPQQTADFSLHNNWMINASWY